MRAVIHQPYFLPWLGFFSKLARADVFIALDNVAFRKRHYFDRTRIINMHGDISWLSLPTGQHLGQQFSTVRISDSQTHYIDAMLRTIEHSYARARHFPDVWPRLRPLLELPLLQERRVTRLNVQIIVNIAGLLDISMPRVYCASDARCESVDATGRILCLCREFGVSSILIGDGSSLAVHKWSRIIENGIQLQRLDFFSNHPRYHQCRRSQNGFVPGLSVIDSMLNVGIDNTREFLLNSKICHPEPV